MSDGSVRGSAPDPPGPDDPLEPSAAADPARAADPSRATEPADAARTARAADPACAADPPYPADVPDWQGLTGSSHLYDLSGPAGPPPADPFAPPRGLPRPRRLARSRLLVVAGITMGISAAARGPSAGGEPHPPPPQAPHVPALTLGNSTGVQVGDPVVAFGSPLGLAGTVTSGIVSALNRPLQTAAGSTGSASQVFYDAIQTDAPINPGNSGGPLVNGQAQVIGVTSAIDTLGGDPAIGVQGGSIGLGFAIPINQARLVATELIRTGQAAHAVLGALISTSYRGTGAQIALRRGGGVPPVSAGRSLAGSA